MKREHIAYVVLALALVVSLAVFLWPEEKPPQMVVDARTVALLHESNAVVIRYFYPYSVPGAAVAAGEVAVMYFSAAGKRTIIQAIDVNAGVCYTNEGNYMKSVEENVDACLSTNYPVISVVEAREPSIVMHGETMEVRGPPQMLRSLMVYALSQVFPDFASTYARALNVASSGIGGQIPPR